MTARYLISCLVMALVTVTSAAQGGRADYRVIPLPSEINGTS